MSILIAHHLQEMWDANSEAKFSTNTETLADNIIDFIDHHRNDVSKIIVTMHEPDNYASYDEVDQYGELPPLPEDSHRHLIEYVNRMVLSWNLKSMVTIGFEIQIAMTSLKRDESSKAIDESANRSRPSPAGLKL